ncbi:uncharacterized protein LOC113210236 isoform X2 [Frankliniella occidentalis]|nr:uncharacterized protein LOC113210236 isoform X2 [Frankliniella occidentalis]
MYQRWAQVTSKAIRKNNVQSPIKACRNESGELPHKVKGVFFNFNKGYNKLPMMKRIHLWQRSCPLRRLYYFLVWKLLNPLVILSESSMSLQKLVSHISNTMFNFSYVFLI